MKRLLRTQQTRGFTIAEMVIVITIIGVLLTVGFTVFPTAQRDARDHQRETNMKLLAAQLDLYFTENGHYPIDQSMKTSAGYTWVKNNLPGFPITGLIAPNAPPGTTNSIATSGPATRTNYRYYAYQADGSGCFYTAEPPAPGDPEPEDCVSFQIDYYSEAKGQVLNVKSRRR
ncbi:type II secretion system protein [Candidatus Saccharibacteria bacterium]|nr:type II secretion system protein [Candidatus Saccharibacteria bacterium]